MKLQELLDQAVNEGHDIILGDDTQVMKITPYGIKVWTRAKNYKVMEEDDDGE